MAEALVLIGLVANVFQFIEQGWSILSASKEIYHSARGTTKAVEDLRLLVNDLIYSIERAKILSSTFRSVDEIAIRDHAAECTILAQELLTIIDKLTAKPKSKFLTFETLKVALHGAVKKKEMERLQERLKKLDGRMRIRLSNVLGDRRYSSIAGFIQDLDRTNKRMELGSSTRFEHLAQSISAALADSSAQTTEVVALVVQLHNQAEATAAHQRVLTSLMFDDLEQRYSDIAETYNTTSDWIFDPARTEFADWLGSGSGIFWISGLAGSGKSTLMKYLCDQERTKEALERWASPAMLIVANFFFWHQGSRMQKSQQGLLQSLLFQILQTDQDLWRTLCPDYMDMKRWAVKELFSTIDKVSTLPLVTTKICFFIDGLDEYEGEEFDIIRIVNRLSKCSNIKLCISSRPWNAFRFAFGSSCPSIALEEYTLNDLKFYVQEELAVSDAFLKSVKQDPRCQEIDDQIATRAQGVWLWVFLVVRGLQRDIQSLESYNHLRRRVAQIPPRLDDYFRQMWSHIDPIYRMESARILLVMLQYEESGMEKFPLLGQPCLESALERDDYALVEEIKDWSRLEVLQEYEASFLNFEEVANIRINDRCKDLVLVRKTEGNVIKNTWGNSELSIYRYHLGFLHRTVRDFLRQNFYDTLAVDAKDFSPIKSLFKVSISLFKRHAITVAVDEIPIMGKAPPAPGRFHPIFLEFWQLAHEQKAIIEDNVVNEFIRVLTARSKGPWLGLMAKRFMSPYKEPLVDEKLSSISFAIFVPLPGYVRRNWKSDTVQRFEALGISPLALALPLHTPYMSVVPRYVFSNAIRRRNGVLFTDPETVKALLDLGCDPNFTPPHSRQSIGLKILRNIFQIRDVIDVDGGFASEKDLYQTIKLLFSRKLICPEQSTLIRVDGSTEETLTRDIVEEELNILLGMTKTRKLMALLETPSPTMDSGSDLS